MKTIMNRENKSGISKKHKQINILKKQKETSDALAAILGIGLGLFLLSAVFKR